MKRLVLLLALLAGAVCATAQITTIRVLGKSWGIPGPEAVDPRSMARRTVFEEFHRQNPDLLVVNAGGLELTGAFGESGLLMSMAGDTAPDVFYVNFRQYFSYIDQGFCLPLGDMLATDPDALQRIHPKIMEVLESYDGELYAIPFFQVAQALYYRKDHFTDAGLDPSKPPRTWDEFYEYGQKLTEASPGRSAFVFPKGGGGGAYWWTNYVWQAGGEVLIPADRGYSRAAIGTPETALALDYYRHLVLDKWTGADGKTHGPVTKLSTDYALEVNEHRASMWFSYTDDMLMGVSEINPSLIGVAAMPAGPAGSVGEINSGMWAINASITDPEKLEACWKFIKFYSSQEAARISTDRFVELGMESLISPIHLKQFGYEDLAARADPLFVEANENLFLRGRPEPYGRNSQQVYVVLEEALERAIYEPERPALEILLQVESKMNDTLLDYVDPALLAKQRGWAAGFLAVVLLVSGWLLVKAWKRAKVMLDSYEERLAAGADKKRIHRFMFWCILPAGGLILVWSYWPLLQGLIIAFQDYRIMGESSWVGLDNFIAAFTQPVFWKSLWNSIVYVILTLVFGFFAPIFLAIALNEIPKFKVLFRTIFYLPAMTSPIVIAFMWRQFYDPLPEGLLNSLMAPLISRYNGIFGTQIPLAHDWLGDPSLAMFAVVIPGIWAAAGPGSILYLAAMKNIPDERYEAADIDGAGWFSKIRFITMPGLQALILINLLGSFIAGFKAMENIFVLTAGGPMHATHTIGLEVWMNAFMFLKFGYATAAAWVMGAILIGFTVVQIKHLTKMKFTTAKA